MSNHQNVYWKQSVTRPFEMHSHIPRVPRSTTSQRFTLYRFNNNIILFLAETDSQLLRLLTGQGRQAHGTDSPDRRAANPFPCYFHVFHPSLGGYHLITMCHGTVIVDC